MRRLVSATILSTIVAVSLHGQSLADVARKAKEERDKAKQAQTRAVDGKAEDPKSETAPAKVYTNSDLPESPARVAANPAADRKTEAAVKDVSTEKASEATPSTSAAPTKPGPTPEQLRDIERTEQMAMLKKFKDLHRDLQNALEDASRKYGDECTSLHLQVTEPCPTWHRRIVVDLPSSIRNARKEIVSLAIKLGLDPERELR